MASMVQKFSAPVISMDKPPLVLWSILALSLVERSGEIICQDAPRSVLLFKN